MFQRAVSKSASSYRVHVMIYEIKLHQDEYFLTSTSCYAL